MGGTIEIVSGEGSELSVTETSQELEDDAKMHYYIKDGKLTIHYCKALYREDVDTAKKNLRVEVPDGIELDIDSVNADVKAGEISLGEMKLTNVSGNVELGGIACNEIEIENVDGTVTASEIVADEFSADSVSGAISISKISANEIKVKTVSGKTSLGVAKRSEVKVSSVSGNVELTIPESLGAIVEFSTMSGNFSSDMPHKTSNKTYTFGFGEIEVSVETVSGNLNVT